MQNVPSSIIVSDDMKETRSHGRLDYPLGIYETDLHALFMGFIRWHWHEEIEIDVVVEGSISILVGDKSYVLSKGDAIFINHNVMHSIYPIPNQESKLVALVFHPSILFGHGNTLLSSHYLLPILEAEHMESFLINRVLSNYSEFYTLLQSIIKQNLDCEFGYEILTKADLSKLWYLLLKRIPPNTNITKVNKAILLDENRVKDAVQFIEQHYSSTITLEDIANSIHISKSECCRCFKRILQITPFQYLMKYRIFQAARIMRNELTTNYPISELAGSVGFNNISYFNKLFKQYMFCTPSQYKQMIISGNGISIENKIKKG